MGNEMTTTEKKARVMVTDYSKGIFGTSDNFLMAMQMAKALAESTIVPEIYRGNPSNCLIAIEQAQRLNMSPMMVMQHLFVIQGRPAWASKFLIAMINASGKYDIELQFDEVKDKNGKPFACTAWTEKNGRRIEGMTVDMDMARDEKWLTKNGSKWQTMPQLMLRYRAASFFSSLNCPELTLGLYTKEEIIDGDFREISVENLSERVQSEITQNANSVPFEQYQIKEKTLPPQMPKAAEKEPVTANTGGQPLPDFMRAE